MKEEDKRGNTYYRWNGILLGMVVLVVVLLCGVHAKATTETDERVIRVGDVYYDIAKGDSQEHGEGYLYEYLARISKITGWKYEYVEASWTESLEMLKRGEIDILPRAQYTKEREEEFLYPDYSMGVEYTYLLARKDNDELFYDDYESFNGKKIGAIRNTYQIKLLEEEALNRGFQYTLVEYDLNEELIDAFLNGEVDLALNERVMEKMECKVVSCFKPNPIYFITAKEQTELFEKLNDALEKIQTLDVNYHGELYDKYYEALEYGSLAYTKEEAEFLRNHPVLKINYNTSWNPLSYQDRETGEYKGIIPDIMDMIANELGISFSYIPVTNCDDMWKKFEDGKVDLLFWVPTQYMNEAAENGIVVTEPYLSVPFSIATMDERSLQHVQTVAVPQNNRALELYAKYVCKGKKIVACKDIQTCLEQMYNRKVDAVFENVYVLTQFQRNESYSDIEITYPMQQTASFGIGVRQEDYIIASILSKAISRIPDKDITKIVIENTMTPPNIDVKIFLRRYLIPIVIIFGGLVIVELIISKRRIKKYAFEDLLTGFSNETKFLLDVEKIKKKNDYIMVSLDIDHFKMINNMWGYDIGNHVLIEISEIIKEEIDQAKEFFCRKADDHFLICLEKKEKDATTARVKKILTRISELPKRESMEFLFTVSCGVCYMEDVAEDVVHRSIGWASMARKMSKKEKMDGIVFYDTVKREQAIKEQQIVNQMDDALERGEICAYYQPQVCIKDGKIIGAEALARWIKPDGTSIYPDEFIPIFEKNGFIIRLDLHIFEGVCKNLRRWLDQGLKPCRVSVNVSRVHLRDENFYLSYLEIMRKYQIPARYIELELTESAIFENKDQMIELISTMREHGIMMAMDDFGSGYSSLNLMKDLPVDFLKIDKEFFNGSMDDSRGQVVVKSITEMAYNLKISVIAEGVETKEQVKFLSDIDCDIVQGYFYYRPMSAEAFERELQEQS